MEISGITLKLKDKNSNLDITTEISVEDAKKLKELLNDMFQPQTVISITPVYHPYMQWWSSTVSVIPSYSL